MKPCDHTTPVDGCRVCHLYASDPAYRNLWGGDVAQVVCGADGVGDVLLGLSSCAGLKRDNPARQVVYSLLGTAGIGAPWLLGWARLFTGYDEVRLNRLPDLPTYHPHSTYDVQNRERLANGSRAEYYARACGTTPALPQLRPLSPSALEWAEQYRGAVVLSPFSVWACRAWLPSHWLTLERMLMDDGRQVVILDGRTDDVGRTRLFRGTVLKDEPAERVAAVMLGADAFVGQDSGMSHLAGLIGVPSVVLSAQIRGEKLFGLYPTVAVVEPEAKCIGCHWQGSAGWHPVCDTLCAALQMITPERVFSALTDKLIDGRTLLSRDRLATLVGTAARCCDLDGDLAELGVYRGGSALAISQACPAKRLHLFDTWGGIPEDDQHGQHRAGDFSTDLDSVKAYLAGRNVAFHPGVFPESAAGLEDVKLSFAHIDFDTYQSVRAAIEWVWPRLVPGGCAVFDDVGWDRTPGVQLAIEECLPGVPIEKTAFIQGRICKKDKAYPEIEIPDRPMLPRKNCQCGSKKINLPTI